MSGARSIVLAAGGTGGHLFPAFALAEELGRRGVAVDLMTDMRGDRYGGGFPARAIYQVPSATLASRAPADVAKTVLTLAQGTKVAFGMLKRVKPDAVIGFGGYPTYPPLVAARLRGIPTAIHEQNAVLGRANKMLAKRVTAVATSFDKTKFLEGSV
ncbi:MAG TPA: glycosyltransferase, partial [Hyphomicrobium sp.]